MSDETKIPLPRSLQEIVGSLLFASEYPLSAKELRDAVKVSEMCRAGIAVVSAGTAARAARNLEDLHKRFLTGLAEG